LKIAVEKNANIIYYVKEDKVISYYQKYEAGNIKNLWRVWRVC
jgi:hypothetical protein